MSVQRKLILLLVAAIAGIALVFTATRIGGGISERMLQLERLAVDAELDVLQSRRQEKNFFLRKKDEYAQSTLKYMDSARKKLHAIIAEEPSKAGEAGTTNRLLDGYRASFAEIAEAERRIGLTEEDGLYREFIAAGRDMEKVFESFTGKDMIIALLQMRRQEKNYQLRRDAKYLERQKKHYAEVGALLDASAQDGQDVVGARAVLARYQSSFEKYVRTLEDRDRSEAAMIEAARALEPSILALREHFGAERARVTEMVDNAILAVQLLGGVLLALITLWVLVSVTRPLKGLRAYSRAIASGDLDAKPQGEFTAEFGDLSSDITRMVNELRARMDEARAKGEEARAEAERAEEALAEAQRQEAKVRALWDRMRETCNSASECSVQVAAASEQLSAMIAQVKQGALTQKNRMGETAMAMEQMNEAVGEVARSAAEASSSAKSAKGKAREGADMVERAASAILSVSGSAERMRAGMDNLGQQVEAIGQVMVVISEIADQTNLLALNAAIEAARAGDAGRGFAVVADEVRKLAEKTMQATGEVGGRIQSIRQATAENVKNVQAAMDAVRQSAELATASGRSQEDILRLVDLSSVQVESIASASEQQSASSVQISRAVEEVSRIADESADGMVSSHEAVLSLTRVAHDLRALMQRMLQTA